MAHPLSISHADPCSGKSPRRSNTTTTCPNGSARTVSKSLCPTSSPLTSFPGKGVSFTILTLTNLPVRPRIRDYLIEDGKTPEKEVIVAIMSNLQIDWPHSAEELFSWDYETGVATGVSTSFLVHVRDLNNWAINAKLLAKYPFLSGMARFLKVEAELEDVRGHN